MIKRNLVLFVVLCFVALCLPWGCAADGNLEDYLSSGACTADGKCADGYTCDKSQTPPQCMKGTADGSVDPCASCLPNEVCCAGACTDTTSSSAHCGGCDKPCPGTSCQSSACTTTCVLPFLDCD